MTFSGGRRLRLTKGLRLAAAAVFIVIASLLLFFILRSRPSRPPEEPARSSTAEKKVDEKVRIRYVEYRGDREKVEFTADRTFVGPDDLYHMVGNVQIIDHGRKGGQRIVLRGEEVVHDSKRNRYAFQGPVQILYKDALVQTSHLAYNRQTETFQTDQPVEASSPQFRGQALGLAYDLKTGRLVLAGDLLLEISAAEAGPPLVVRGKTLVYHSADRKGSIQGGVRLSHGRSWGTCREVDFSLFAKSDKLSLVYLRGDARLSLRNQFGKTQAASGSPAFLRLGDDQDIQADEIKLRAFLDRSLLHSYESSGACSIQFISSGGRRTRFQAEAIDFVFDQGGGLREFRSFTGARMTQEEKDPGQTRTVEGDSAVLPGGSDWLQVRVKPGRKARAALGLNEILAGELDFSLERNDLEGRVAKVVLTARGGESPGVFFEKGEPVFVTAGVVRYNSEDERFDFLNNVRMWQNRKMLLAGQLTFWETLGKASGEGGVRASFPHQPKTRQNEEKVEVSARGLDSLPQENKMVFQEGAALHLEKAEIRADTIQVHLNPDSREMERMTALGHVVINQNAREGRGEQAVYTVEEDQIVLTGNPYLLDRDRGQIEGRKLTFHLGDGTIAVENKGRERSLTLIKSSLEQ